MSSSNNGFLKPICIGAVAVGLDKFYLQEQNMQRSLIFGALTASGSYLSEIVAPHVVPNLPSLNAEIYNGKQLGERITEVGIDTASVYVVNKYVLGNDIYRDEMLQRMGVIAVADVVGTYISEYIDGQPLQYIQ